MNNQLVLVEKKDGIAIFGKVLPNGRLGKFEVHVKPNPTNPVEFALLTDAEGKMNGIIFARKAEEAKRKEAERAAMAKQVEAKGKIVLEKLNKNAIQNN